MSVQFAGFLFFLLSVILFAATKAGAAYDRKYGYGISAFFLVYALLFEIAGYLDSELILLLIFALPVGTGMTLAGFWMILKGFFYSLKMEGTYIDCVYYTTPTFRRGKLYKLIFEYQANGCTIRSRSEDNYILYDIEKHFKPRQVYTIWVNPKNLQDFRAKRFSGAAGGLLIVIVFGIGALPMIIQTLLKLLGTRYF